MDTACDHSGLHSGGTRYLRELGQLVLLLVCDDCGAERAEFGTIEYAPNPRRLVARLAELTALALGLGAGHTARIRFAALVCAVGRDQISPEILVKRSPLSDAEWAEVRRQPELSAAVLCDISLDDIREWILCHRERPDGSGYPRGLTAEQIPLEARILAVCDAYTAMVSDRPHRLRRTHMEACAELVRYAGSQFDAKVVGAFLSTPLMRELELDQAAA
jgi:HD-GYP domain-containing protein (c-di-GMP phosphodiesterase class II)